MVTISTRDLFNTLHTDAERSLRAADQNQSGVLTVAEAQSVDPTLAPVVAAVAGANNFRIDQFMSVFDRGVSSILSRADRNGDGALDAGERASLPAFMGPAIGRLISSAPAVPAAPIGETPATPAGPGAFGIAGTVPASRVTLETLLDRDLAYPSAMAYKPQDGSLWITNRRDDSLTIVDRPGQPDMRAQRFADTSDHFMNNPTALAFSRGRDEFATTQESRNEYNGHSAANDFMGPTLWTADRAIFRNGDASHLDMVHHSPDAMGIAAGEDSAKREYWIMNGLNGAIDRYFFHEPHELGGHDHADGQTFRYAAGELKRSENVPSHMALDTNDGKLYVADTGNGRVVALATREEYAPRRMQSLHEETPLFSMPGSSVETIASGLVKPSGLLLKGDDLIVADHGTGYVHVFGKDGTEKGKLDTGLGAGRLTGLCESPAGELLALDAGEGRLLKVSVS